MGRTGSRVRKVPAGEVAGAGAAASGLAGLLALFAGCFLASSLDPSAPLGEPRNPIRCDGKRGALEYMGHLRCPDRSVPHVKRSGRTVGGPYRNALEGYDVRCIWINREMRLYFDPQHPEHVEVLAPPGFTLAPRGSSPAIPCEVQNACR